MDQFLIEIEALKDNECISKFKFSLTEALATLEEHQRWVNLGRNEN